VTSALFKQLNSPVSVLTGRHHARVSFTIRDGYADDVRLKGDARLIYRATITPETLEGSSGVRAVGVSPHRDPAASVTVAWWKTFAGSPPRVDVRVPSRRVATPIDQAPFLAIAVTLLAWLVLRGGGVPVY
jgi:hypothetical protein